MLSLRLKTIADLVPNNSKIINVGTDHALLEIFLAKEKNVSSVGIDISYNSVLKSKNNVAKENFENKIQIIQNDGLENIKINDEIITLSGLGTHTILNILENITNNDLIIQSNNNIYELRKELCKKGYYIYDEKVIFDKKWYVIIYFKKGNVKYTDFELYVGPKINNQEYINYLIQTNNEIIKDIPLIEKEKIEEINKRIEKLKKL